VAGNNSVLAKMVVELSANTAKFTKSMHATQKSFADFTGGLTKLAGAVGIAFSVKEIAQFGLELGKLSGQAEGVRAAFERLPESEQLMKNLKEATGGTVSELELMKRAVQANNFEISLAALPRLLEFATLRAQQTGQSVDYLVDSIVTGIGRKSKLILDNLGISAVQLNEALGGSSTAASSIGEVADAVGKIAEDNLKNMAGFAENTATKIQRLDSSWENLKVTLGDLVNNVGLPDWIDQVKEGVEQLNQGLTKGATTQGLQSYVDMFNRMQPSGLAFLQMHAEIEEMSKRLGIRLIGLKDKATGAYKIVFDPRTPPKWINPTNKVTGELIITLESLKEKMEGLNDEFEITNVNDKKKLQNIGAQIIAINAQIEALEKLRKAEKDKNKFSKMDAAFFDPTMQTDFAKFGNNKSGENFMKDLGMDAKYFNDQLEQAASNVKNIAPPKNVQQQWIDFTGIINSGLSGIGRALGSAISGSQKLGDALLGVLGGVLVQLGEMLITAGVGVEAFKTSLRTLQGPIAIAAGVALIALGSAISSSISNLGSSNGRSSDGASTRSFQGAKAGNFNTAGLEIQVGGEFRVRGQDLIYIINRQDQKNGRTRG
jgi:hypothetical protein